MKTTIILAASSHQLDALYNNQIIPVRGKPAISWVIEECLDSKVILTLSSANTRVINYVTKRYPEVKIVRIDSVKEEKKVTGFSILDSLAHAMEAVAVDTELLTVVLGDTMCRNVPKNNDDFVVVSDDFASSERWCLVECDENANIKELFDKQVNLDIKNKKALIGYYQFAEPNLVQKLLLELIYAQKTQISDLLRQYNKQRPIKCVETKEWFDFGHKAGLIKAQNYFYNSRDFNSLKSDPVAGIITKSSSNCKKLEDEYCWYKGLPDKLKVLVPRVLDFYVKEDKAFLSMEMYGYPPLSELFILGNLSLEEWQLVIRRLFEVHRLFEKCEGELPQENFYDLYLHKTWQRLKDLHIQNVYWQKLWTYDEIVINGVVYKNIRYFETRLNDAIEGLVQNVKVSVMHGDYCFSNILFDTNSFICRLIDPRGRLGQQTVYGDARYDIAKLRHSVVGGYDFAVHGLFNLVERENVFEISGNYPDFQEKLTEFFDKTTVEFGFDLNEIRLIEALLFLSMIPLHKDNFERQKVFYLKAVKKINAIFTEK